MISKRKSAKTRSGSNGRAKRQSAGRRPRKQVPEQPPERQLETFRGILQDFNFGPKGGVEGFVLHSDDQTVQVNVSADVGFAVVRGIGQNVEATVEPATENAKPTKGDHSVYNLVSLSGADGKTLIFADAAGAEPVTVQGTVKRINYNRSGAANGVILESGNFVYLEPAAMKRAGLKVGDQVTAEGTATLMPLGQKVIEAKTINGIAVSSRKRGSF